MAVQINTKLYRDLDLNFTRHPATGDVVCRYNDQAIIASIRNLIYLSNYEKPFHPEIGSTVRQMLFENITPITAQNLKNAIRDVIQSFEPRVKIREIVVQANEDSNQFEVIISFYIQNRTESTTISVFLERVR